LPIFFVLEDGLVQKILPRFDELLNVLGLRALDDESRGQERSFPNYKRARHEMFLQQVACGPLSLIKILEAFGRPLPAQEADKLIEEAGDKGIDMLRLKQLAEQYGLYALGAIISPTQLRELGCRAIVHFDSMGFVPILGYVADGVIIAYPLGPVGILPDDLFTHMFGEEGKALLLADRPLDPIQLGLVFDDEAPTSSCGLQAAQSMLTVGRLYQWQWHITSILINTAKETRKIQQIQASSPSVRAWTDQQELAPGAIATLYVQGKESRLGGFTHLVTIQTAEEPDAPLQVPLRGYIEQPVLFTPPAVFLRGLLPGQSAELRVEVEIPRQMPLPQLQVRCSGESLFKSGESPLKAKWIMYSHGRYLTLNWQGKSTPGLYHGELLAWIGEKTTAVPARLPWAVEVISPVCVYPPSLWIETLPGETWRRQLCITAQYDIPGAPKLHWSVAEVAKAVRVQITRDGSRRWRVLLCDSGKEHSGEVILVIRWGDQELTVPVRFRPQITFGPR
jgi:hypothetical protein